MQLRGADYAHHISLSPPKYLTFQRPWHKRQTIAHRSQLRNLYCKYLPLIFKDKKPSYYSNVFWQENLKCFQCFLIDKKTKGKFSFFTAEHRRCSIDFSRFHKTFKVIVGSMRFHKFFFSGFLKVNCQS